MKKLSIKLKITIWFTGFMILLSSLILAFTFFLSSNSASGTIKNTLISIVDENTEEVEFEDGELDIDEDFISFKNGINCLIFDANGKLISGDNEYSHLTKNFEDRNITSLKIKEENYFLYDRQVGNFWIRGFVSKNNSAISINMMYQALVISLPLLILLAAIGGYLIASRSLSPIKKISFLAKEIEESGDLSKRIELNTNKDELYQLAVTFNQMFSQLENNFEAERHFTSDASHELRTPLSIILAQCEYAFEHAKTKEELYETITAIQKQGYRMSKLINSLLQFTRIEQQIENTNLKRINFSNFISSICQEYLTINSKNILLIENIQADIFFEVDSSLMTRLIQNLLQNAYRYGKENGKIYIQLEENQNTLSLSVSDDGIGIDETDLPHIWNRFYQADKARTHNKGWGLGLAMVKQIAEFHKGKVEVKSKVMQGTTFKITFKK
ncbi:MAG: ATP-binding protein [Lactovum sp.]